MPRVLLKIKSYITRKKKFARGAQDETRKRFAIFTVYKLTPHFGRSCGNYKTALTQSLRNRIGPVSTVHCANYAIVSNRVACRQLSGRRQARRASHGLNGPFFRAAPFLCNSYFLAAPLSRQIFALYGFLSSTWLHGMGVQGAAIQSYPLNLSPSSFPARSWSMWPCF